MHGMDEMNKELKHMIIDQTHVSAFVCAFAAILGLAAAAQGAAALPVGGAPRALDFPHFPDRLHAFVWRNWTLVEPARLAQVLGTSTENVAAIAESMGLPPPRPIPPEMRVRGYITILRRNWHLLPYDQLLTLLGMSADELAYALREDDFLFIKLGSLKPSCPPLLYAPPSDEARRRAAEIRRTVEEAFGDEIRQPGQPRFAFVQELSQPRVPRSARPTVPTGPPQTGTAGQASRGTEEGSGKPLFSLRFIYSYFALYGDPLMNPELDPYPDGLLQRLADLGVNGVWMHTVLRTLAPSATFPEFGAGHETRLANLRKLVERAKRYGIAVYLYMNEPRAMPTAFFKDRPDLKGVQEGDHAALCTSAPEVRAWLSDSLAYVFKSVPDLGGVFTITASENLTNCASHGQFQQCPRCKSRAYADIIAEANAAIEAGVHKGNPDAKVIAWDWGWNDTHTPEIIAKLQKSIWLMSVSEWSLPLNIGGVRTSVAEYSISAVGPGPRATSHWALAKKAGLRTVARVSFNCTWELSAIPYLPTLDLVAEHCSRLATTGVDGLMLSWSLGGYPSPNLELAAQFASSPAPSKEAALDAIALARFGPEGAPHARRAWTAFSTAFREFPYSCGLYTAPMQFGPSNLLYASPTGYGATMVGIPYDDVRSWCGAYPPNVFVGQFRKVADGWKAGLPELELGVRALARNAPGDGLKAALQTQDRLADARAELAFAEAAQLHFASVATQARFTLARNALLAKDKPPAPDQRKALLAEMRETVQSELASARRLFTLAQQDSRIGYEASNHYYYVPIDLVEKVINCRYILDKALPQWDGPKTH